MNARIAETPKFRISHVLDLHSAIISVYVLKGSLCMQIVSTGGRKSYDVLICCDDVYVQSTSQTLMLCN